MDYQSLTKQIISHDHSHRQHVKNGDSAIDVATKGDSPKAYYCVPARVTPTELRYKKDEKETHLSLSHFSVSGL